MKTQDAVIYGTVALAAVALVWWQSMANSASLPAEIKMPQLTAKAQVGQEKFVENCAACHGANAGGTGQGPSLIHIIYEPGHHSDASFYAAAKSGVRQHHWNFGNMPPVTTVNEDDISKIIAFIREVQRANGIN